MIAKSEWFSRRKYSGWGLFPKTWQGVVYTIAIALITAILVYLPLEIQYKLIVIAIWAIVLTLDIGKVMICVKDEREKIHEALAERNALWAVIIILAIGLSYQISSSVVKQDFSSVDWFLVAAMIIALIVKAVSNIYLDKKN